MKGILAAADDVYRRLVKVMNQNSLVLGCEYDRQRQAYMPGTADNTDIRWRLICTLDWQRLDHFNLLGGKVPTVRCDLFFCPNFAKG